jgi:hypothetical protein
MSSYTSFAMHSPNDDENTNPTGGGTPPDSNVRNYALVQVDQNIDERIKNREGVRVNGDVFDLAGLMGRVKALEDGIQDLQDGQKESDKRIQELEKYKSISFGRHENSDKMIERLQLEVRKTQPWDPNYQG